MPTYITGKLSNPLTEKDRDIFSQAEKTLLSLGRVPVNPLSQCQDVPPSWPVRMGILNGCDSIYLLPDWHICRESVFEMIYSDLYGKELLFAEPICKQQVREAEEKIFVGKISEVIHSVTGLTYSDFTQKDRGVPGYLARLIFAHNCERAGMPVERIKSYIPRSKNNITRYLEMYSKECEANPCFRRQATEVWDKLWKEKDQ
jgi:hypothetical protein